MPTQTDDIRITGWSLLATAGMTTTLQFTSPDALTSLSIYTGGTVTDVDDLTDATEHAAVLSGGDLTATVDLAVPDGTVAVALRLVVNGAVQTVGRLHPRVDGTSTPDNTITLVAGVNEFDLTILGVLQSGGGEGGSGAPVGASYLVTAAHVDLTNEVVVGATPGGELGGTWAAPTVDAVHSGSSHAAVQAAAEATAAAALAVETAARAAADTALDTRVDALEAVDPLTQAEGDARYWQLTTDLATQAELNAEATTRGDADTALDGRLDTAEATLAGLGTLATQDDIAVPGDITATGTPSASTFLRGDGAWAIPAGGGSGVVETIVAGTNIDVDDTDPANPIVSLETLVDADIPASIARDAEVAAAYQPLDADLTALAAAGNSAVLAATTASFLTADETKLDGIEAGAQVNPTTEVLQDLVGAMVSGGTETGIAVTYDDTNARLDFVAEVTQAELDLKADLASPALTGTPTAPTPSQGDNDTSIATTAFVNAEIAADAVPLLNVPVVVAGTTDTLAAADLGKINRYTNASAVVVTIPTDASDDLADGFNCTLIAEGAGGLSLDVTGITVAGGSNTAIAQGEALVVVKTATANTWLVIGGTA